MAPNNSELETNTHVFFLRGVFSNFTSTPGLQYKGNTFHTTEQAFMWAKANGFRDRETARKILAEKNPAKAKILGREVKPFSHVYWDLNKEFLMYEVNLAKYSQFEDYRKILLATGDKELVEANGRPDLVWSCGLYVSHKDILNEKYMPYKYEIVQEIYFDAEAVFNLEEFLKNYIVINGLHYIPLIPFGGHLHECFKYD